MDAKEMTLPQEELKPLGILAAYFHTRARLGVDSCVIATAKYETNAGRPLDRTHLFPALEEVVRKNAELGRRVCYETESGKPAWTRLQSLDFNRIVEFLDADSSSLEFILETQFMRGFNLKADLPLWRLAVLSDGTVIYAYDHFMGDGLSGRGFHFSLLSALQTTKPTSEWHSGLIFPRSDVQPIPLVEEIIHIPVPFTWLLSEVLKPINPFYQRRFSRVWSGNPVPKTFKFDVNVRILHVVPEDSARLVKLCRSHHTTVTGALYALVSHIFSRLLHIGQSDAQPYDSIIVHVPVSLRRYTNASPSAICNHVAFYEDMHKLRTPPPTSSMHAHPSLSEFPWKAAAEFSDLLKREAPKTPGILGVLNLLLGSREGPVLAMLGQKRDTTVGISNLGPIPPGAINTPPADVPDSTAQWQMRELLFVQADAPAGSALKVNVTGTPAGGIGITLTWGKESMDEGFADECVEAFKAGLKELTSADAV
ncbi:alcohol acetyltransferase [Lenzites betulinus]|nr:alcohol acetyltransferase [Lenzites betulinus]